MGRHLFRALIANGFVRLSDKHPSHEPGSPKMLSRPHSENRWLPDAATLTDDAKGMGTSFNDDGVIGSDPLDVQPEYAISIADSADVARPGDSLTYTIKVENNGNRSGYDLVVTIVFPTLVLDNVTASSGGVVDGVAGTINWIFDELLAGSSQILTVETRVRDRITTQTSSIELTATVTDDVGIVPGQRRLRPLECETHPSWIVRMPAFQEALS